MTSSIRALLLSEGRPGIRGNFFRLPNVSVKSKVKSVLDWKLLYGGGPPGAMVPLDPSVAQCVTIEVMAPSLEGVPGFKPPWGHQLTMPSLIGSHPL